MKLSAKRRALLDELSTLVKAVHGPQAMALPYNLGVQILGTGVHACSSWDHLGHEVERYRSKVDDAATNGDKRVAEIHETAEAFGEEDPLDADGGECELIAAGASLCAEAIEALMEVTKWPKITDSSVRCSGSPPSSPSTWGCGASPRHLTACRAVGATAIPGRRSATVGSSVGRG